MPATVLNLLLLHQEPEVSQAFIRRALMVAQNDNLLLAYGGTPENFENIDYEPKLFIKDQRLRTHDHQREAQSYSGIFRAAADWMKNHPFEFVHFLEYDHVPLVSDLNERQISRLRRETADVLAFRLTRIDDTNHPHFLRHAADPEFEKFFADKSCRVQREVVLSMLVTGSFWTREAFKSVAQIEEPFPIYMEVYLSTLAHHLGFRLRDYGEQDPFVSHRGDRGGDIETARERGAWSLHPVKEIPSARRTG